ncbi:MAG: hypothetical protein D8M59_11470 [Planctomycetes bacterium]|nr:hypothetical protein [Planctomycetota bacterium]NOG55380.1 hypothetical protein [Planctomycetota bacterium]
MSSADHDSLVELTVCHTELEAQLLKERLGEEGIDAVVFSTASEGLGFMTDTTFPHGGAQVRVREADQTAAHRILRTFEAEHEEGSA